MSKRSASILALIAVSVVAAGCGGGDKPPPPPPTPGTFERAIAALGGRTRLSSIRSIEIRTHGDEDERPYRARVRVKLPDHIRIDKEASDADLVMAQAGPKAWEMFEDLSYPVKPEELKPLRQNWRLLHLSLLVPLETTKDVTIRESGRDGELEVLEVTFPDEPRGPFKVWFDSKSYWPRRVEWTAEIYGERGTHVLRLDLLDHKTIDGLLVTTRSRFLLDGQFIAEDRVDAITFNSPIEDSCFQEPDPKTDPPIRTRTAAALTVALLEHVDSGTSALERAEHDLQKWIDRYSLKRNGPVFYLEPVAEGHVPAVAVPIIPPPAETRPTTRGSDDPRISTFTEQDVYTTAVLGRDESKRAAARKRLTEKAKADGVEIAGPCRIVLWSADITQLQLPVRRKKG